MAALNEIPGLSAKIQELLEAGEVNTAEDLAAYLSVDLHRNLQIVNKRFDVLKRIPSVKVLGRWIEHAQELTGVEPGEEHTPMAAVISDEDTTGEVAFAEVVEGKPSNLPPTEQKGISISSDTIVDEGFVTPRGIKKGGKVRSKNTFQTFEEYDPEHVTEEESGGKPSKPAGSKNAGSKTASPKKNRPDKEAVKNATAESAASESAAREEQTSGRLIDQIKPVDHEAASRSIDKRRRGILYPAPRLLFFGSIITILTRTFFWLTLLTLLVVPFFFKEYLLVASVIPGLFLFFGLFYISLVGRVKCRTCSCPLMFSRRCLKNKKAHKIGILSHLMSMSIYIVVIKWFRCMYCGTAIRLKE